jgi:hypothetical protein
MSASKEVRDAIGEAPDLDEQIANLRDALAAPGRDRERQQARLAELEAQRTAQREATGKAKAEERRKGIRRAAGGQSSAIDQAEKEWIAAVEQLVKKTEVFNNVFRQHAAFRDEDAALADRFSGTASTIVPVIPPARRDAVIAAYRNLRETALDERSLPQPQYETDETGLRSRRSYQEIEGTEGFEIIQEVGLKPFPPLTVRQHEIAALRTQPVLSDAERNLLASEAAASPRRFGR